LAGIAVTVLAPGSQAGTQTVKCSSPTNIAGISVTNGLFDATTAAGGFNEDDPGGQAIAFSVYTVVQIANT